jgi:hypothetical protein
MAYFLKIIVFGLLKSVARFYFELLSLKKTTFFPFISSATIF